MDDICCLISGICCVNLNSAKIGIEGVNSNLATAIRTIVVVIMAWGMVFLTHARMDWQKSVRKAGFF